MLDSFSFIGVAAIRNPIISGSQKVEPLVTRPKVNVQVLEHFIPFVALQKDIIRHPVDAVKPSLRVTLETFEQVC